jgi:hypothetical protein
MSWKGFDLISCLSDLPENRYAALEEAQKLLCFTAGEWRYFLKVLRKADGWLSFRRGDVGIIWTRHEGDDKLHLCLELNKHCVERGVTYTFRLSELEALRKKRQLSIKSLRGE